LSQQGMDCIYIPQIPIADITTDAAWLYSTVAKYMILNQYSVYDLITEIPVEGEASKKTVLVISDYLNNIEASLDTEDIDDFEIQIQNLADYLGYSCK
ncbi:MAG: ATP-dependent helicase, partial [Bacteroidetes bacterium]|nr:ATP-dependent helicase [Bacteroidota bacterium]